MKKLSLLWLVLAAVLLNPVGAFASDNDKHHHKKHHDKSDERNNRDRLAQIEADRRANGYYNVPRNSHHHHHSN
ncbi:MAG: hypothetical protein WDN28_30215 [Chthoniobacter sp.]